MNNFFSVPPVSIQLLESPYCLNLANIHRSLSVECSIIVTPIKVFFANVTDFNIAGWLCQQALKITIALIIRGKYHYISAAGVQFGHDLICNIDCPNPADILRSADGDHMPVQNHIIVEIPVLLIGKEFFRRLLLQIIDIQTSVLNLFSK